MKSFSSKLVISYLVVVVISFSFVAYFLDKNLEENALEDLESSLIQELSLIKTQISQDSLRKPDPFYLGSFVKRTSNIIGSRLTIISDQGEVLADSEVDIKNMDNHLGRPEIKAALSGGIGKYSRYSKTLKINMLYLAVPLIDGNSNIGAIRIAVPLTNVNNILFAVRKSVTLAFLFASGLAFMIGTVLARGITKPIRRIISASKDLSNGNFSRKIRLDSQDEIKELADTLNKMSDDLENKIRQIERSNQHFYAVFNSMIEAVIVVDAESKIYSINPMAEELFGITKNSVLSRAFLEVIRNNQISEMLNKSLNSGNFVSGELQLIFPIQKTIQANISPIFDKEKVTGSVLVIHDITGIRKLEAMRKDFVANVSHELRTPLTSIKGFVETLLEGAIDDKENNLSFLKAIQSHSERLDSLISDLLSLAYIESGEIVLNKESISIKNFVDEAIFKLKTQLSKNGIKIENKIPNNLSIEADKLKLEQVFLNLLDNAIKFNKPAGLIRIYNQDSSDMHKIVVEDSGIGIPEKDLPRIFERFYRVDKARSRQLGGTGLGLSIVKHIIELHSGEVGVESIEGMGSKFWFIIPKIN